MPEQKIPNREGIVTLRDIAQRCGVAKGTVSKALNNRGKLINPQTAEAIRIVAREMGYDPMSHYEARRLSARRSGRKIINHLIGVVMPSFFYKITYFTEMYYGILDALTREHFGQLTIPVPDRRVDSSELTLPPSLLRGEVDGIIFIGGMEEGFQPLSQLRLPTGNALPTVSVINPSHTNAVVLADDEMGGYQVMTHLLELGHRHFLYVKVAYTVSTLQQRMLGMNRALLERALDPTRHLHILEGDVNRLRYYPPFVENVPMHLDADGETLQQLLRTLHDHPEITAILAQNDLVAQELWYSFKYPGIRIPEDYSLVGYDDTDPLLNEYGANVLTTVHVPLSEIGRAAVQQVIALVNDAADAAPRVVLPTELVIRDTTGAAKGCHV